MSAAVCTAAHKKAKVVLWRIPPKSPDLNPIERVWANLRRRLRALDLADAIKKRPVLGKSAYIARVKRVVKSKIFQKQAANTALGLKKVCREVLANSGHATAS